MPINNLVAEANRLYKQLKAAEKGGESFAKDAYKNLDRLVKSVGKRTFNTRGLSKGQKMLFQNAARKFLESQTSTLEGAKKTQSKRDMQFDNIVRQNYYYKSENLELYRQTIKDLDAAGFFEEMGISPDWDVIIGDVNEWVEGVNKKITTFENKNLDDYVKESIRMRSENNSAWEFYHLDDEPAYIINNITGEIVKEGEKDYEALYQMVTLKKLLKGI